jgi:6-pyruvoyltetrahydropterin/6-carboxytetrahydropterin synthase
MITITRKHEIACGHRVYGHESKCAHLHGHNYMFEMVCSAPTLDGVGRVMDFNNVKNLLCNWLELYWDHKMLLFREDPFSNALGYVDHRGLCIVEFNPTVENIAKYFAEVVAPGQLAGTDVQLVELTVWETSKCSATWKVEG